MDALLSVYYIVYSVKASTSKRGMVTLHGCLHIVYILLTLNSRTQRVLEGVDMSMSGRRSSPVTRD